MRSATMLKLLTQWNVIGRVVKNALSENEFDSNAKRSVVFYNIREDTPENYVLSKHADNIAVINCSQTKFVAIILVLSVFFYAILRLTDFSSDAFDFSSSKTG